MDNVLMGNARFNQAGSEKFGEPSVETKRQTDSSPPKPVDAPPFKGGIDAEAEQGAPSQPTDETPTETPTEQPESPNYLMIAGGLALLYFLFKRKK